VFVPLFRRDSSYTDSSSLRLCAGALLLRPFGDCLKKAATLNTLKINQASKKLTWTDVETYNNQRLQYPRFTNDVVEKGIYKTFQDFLQNRVTKQEFTIQSSLYSDEVFVKENGKKVALIDFWGFCDGSKQYMRVGYNIFELARQNNAYDIWGNTIALRKFQRVFVPVPGLIGLIGTAALSKDKTIIEKKPLQLNMETGEVY
jgi:hypothetical protein